MLRKIAQENKEFYVKVEADLDLEGNSNPSAIRGAACLRVLILRYFLLCAVSGATAESFIADLVLAITPSLGETIPCLF